MPGMSCNKGFKKTVSFKAPELEQSRLKFREIKKRYRGAGLPREEHSSDSFVNYEWMSVCGSAHMEKVPTEARDAKELWSQSSRQL